jgi:hypothetical protein
MLNAERAERREREREALYDGRRQAKASNLTNDRVARAACITYCFPCGHGNLLEPCMQ